MNDVRERLVALTPAQRALLAERIKERRAAEEHPQRLSRGAWPLSVPATPGQERLWRNVIAHPELPLDVVAQVIALSGKLEVPALRRAFEALPARHEALRTGFATEGPRLLQRVEAHSDLLLTPTELFDVPRSRWDAEVERRGLHAARQPFDLAAPPLLRVELLSLAPTEHRLLLTAHNLVFDAWSYSVMLQEVGRLYQAAVEGRDAALPPPDFHLADYAAWLARRREQPGYDAHLAYWRDALAGARGGRLSLGRRDLDRPTRRGRRVEFPLGLDRRQPMAALARREGTTMFAVHLALTQTFVAWASGGRDVTVGALSANRRVAELEPVLGFFLEILPLRAQMTDEPPFGAIVRQAKDALAGAVRHGGVPFDDIAAASVTATDAASSGRHPLFDVLFSFENLPEAVQGWPGLQVRTHDVDKGTARFDLTVSVYDQPDRYQGWIEYDSSLFEERTAKAWADGFVALVDAVAAHPDWTVSQLFDLVPPPAMGR